jgi:hypothetical protein
MTSLPRARLSSARGGQRPRCCLTTSDAGAPVRRRRSPSTCDVTGRGQRAPFRVRIHLEVRIGARDAQQSLLVPVVGDRSARPRFVCRTTPVPLMTAARARRDRDSVTCADHAARPGSPRPAGGGSARGFRHARDARRRARVARLRRDGRSWNRSQGPQCRSTLASSASSEGSTRSTACPAAALSLLPADWQAAPPPALLTRVMTS